MDEKLIQLFVEKILLFRFDILLDMFTATSVTVTENGIERAVKPDEILWHDKFRGYREIWKITLEKLYAKYLPEIPYTFSWKIEITPYTLLLTTLFPDEDLYENQLSDYGKKLGLSDDKLLITVKERFAELDIDLDAFSESLKIVLPKDERELYTKLLRILNFPPLQELANFYEQVYRKYTKGLQLLQETFSSGKVSYPDFRVLEPYHKSVFPFSHEQFKKYGLEYFEQKSELSMYHRDFIEVRGKSEKLKDTFQGKFVCNCCGTISEANVPIDVLQFKFIMEHKELAANIGYIIFDDIISAYKKEFAEKLNDVINDLNPKGAADLYIMVEGASEEFGLPILALKRRISLKAQKIKIYNCGSKDQVFRDFKSFKTKQKNLKMICLLDSDAKKEKLDLERVMKNQKHKYDLVFIEKGAWEDLFPLEQCVKVLNEMYPEGALITVSDFDKQKEFGNQIDRILYEKKKAKFDKRKFSENICWSLEESQIPEPINRVFDVAEKLLSVEKSIYSSPE